MRAGSSQRPRRFLCAWLPLVVVITLLALCAGAAYALGIVEEVGFSTYQNTAPPLAVSAGGVTLASAHARYLTLDTILVTLTNHSGAPIYLREAVGDPACVLSDVEYQSASGWQAIIHQDCWSPPDCGGGDSKGSGPGVGVVAPGQTVGIETYFGQESYPPLAPAAYRFTVEYSPTRFQAPWRSAMPPNSLKLTTPPVMVTSAWWIPPWYHQHLDCSHPYA